jgi:DNA (cytosine-5)-methyltransferase 1
MSIRTEGTNWRRRVVRLGHDFEPTDTGLFLPRTHTAPAGRASSRPLAADLFCGAGGMSLGFHQAGFHVVAASDGWPTAACTYICNLGSPATLVHLVGDKLPDARSCEQKWFAAHADETVTAAELFEVCGMNEAAPGSGWISEQEDEPACEHFYLGDVRSLSGHQLVEDVGAELAAIVGGPPCQGFSVAGKQDVMDPRNSLVFDFMRVICEARPQAFVLENVPGMVKMLTPEGVPVIDALARIAQDGGFGTYDAIRKALVSQSGLGAALRSQKVAGSTSDEGTDGESDQLSLLA